MKERLISIGRAVSGRFQGGFRAVSGRFQSDCRASGSAAVNPSGFPVFIEHFCERWAGVMAVECGREFANGFSRAVAIQIGWQKERQRDRETERQKEEWEGFSE